jgi:hypothetical protein
MGFLSKKEAGPRGHKDGKEKINRQWAFHNESSWRFPAKKSEGYCVRPWLASFIC